MEDSFSDSSNITDAIEHADADSGADVLSDGRAIALTVLVCVASSLSVFGSCSIMCMAWRQLDELLQRLLFALSLSDTLVSVMLALTPLFYPEELGAWGANGDFSTCEAGGFVLMLLLMTGCSYNCLISVYYLAMIRYNWKEKKQSISASNRSSYYGFSSTVLSAISWGEILVHLMVLIVPLAVLTPAAITDSINPQAVYNHCYIGTYPAKCESGKFAHVECQRSSNETVNGLKTAALLIGAFYTAVGLTSSSTVYITVRNKLNKTVRLSDFSNTTTTGNSADTNTKESRVRYLSEQQQQEQPTTTWPPSQRQNSNPFEKRILQVRTQCTLYSLVYINTYAWPALALGLSTSQKDPSSNSYFPFQILIGIFLPIQGFLNFLVYMRPKVQQWKRRQQQQQQSNTNINDIPLVWIWLKLIFNVDIPNGMGNSSTSVSNNTGKNNVNKGDATNKSTTSNTNSSNTTTRQLMQPGVMAVQQCVMDCINPTTNADNVQDDDDDVNACMEA